MRWMEKKGRAFPGKVMGSIFGAGGADAEGFGKSVLGAITESNRILNRINGKPGAQFIG